MMEKKRQDQLVRKEKRVGERREETGTIGERRERQRKERKMKSVREKQ